MGLMNRLVPSDDLIDEARRNRDTIAAQKKIFNKNLVLNPAESPPQSAANVSGILSGPTPQAIRD